MKIIENGVENLTLINLNRMQFGIVPVKKNSRCLIHSEEDAGGISKEGKEVVYIYIYIYTGWFKVSTQMIQMHKLFIVCLYFLNLLFFVFRYP